MNLWTSAATSFNERILFYQKHSWHFLDVFLSFYDMDFTNLRSSAALDWCVLQVAPSYFNCHSPRYSIQTIRLDIQQLETPTHCLDFSVIPTSSLERTRIVLISSFMRL